MWYLNQAIIIELDADTEYELRIGIECEEAMQWSEVIQFRTDLNQRASINQKLIKISK